VNCSKISQKWDFWPVARTAFDASSHLIFFLLDNRKPLY
jgi:hypothetical protein